MAWSMDAATLSDDGSPRRVCDVCGAYSSAPRGSSCTTCTVGVMRYLSELQVVRRQRSHERRAAARAADSR